MADPCTSCTCLPYKNICCCLPQAGISVMQPACQVLSTACSGSTIVTNPCYCDVTGSSTWTYKFFIDCTPETTQAVDYILIPIFVGIQPAQVTVEERVDVCLSFRTLTYGEDKEYVITDRDGDSTENFGPSPAGYNWLKITNSPVRYENGVLVEYRVTITGDYPAVTESIRIKAGTNKVAFCSDTPENSCFLVPGYPPSETLSIVKNCTPFVSNNASVFNYTVTIKNTGGQSFSNILFNDVIAYDANNLAFSSISVTPPLTASSGQGDVVISGDIGTLSPGAQFAATYVLVLEPAADAVPGTYIVKNATPTNSNTAITSDTSSYTTQIVQLSGKNCCEISNGNHVIFRTTISTVGSSPAANVNYVDTIAIPSGITVNFTNFDGCTAALSNGTTVAYPCTLTGPETVTISCSDLPVPGEGKSTTKVVELDVTSTSTFNCDNTPLIVNMLQQATTVNTSTQIYLQPVGIPSISSVRVLGCVTCNNPCS